MKRNGFTLIEVLAVIILIGIISVIIYPKVANTINNSTESTSLLSVEGLIDSLNGYALDKKATLTPFSGCSFDFDKNISSCEEFTYNGNLPESGNISVDSDGIVNGYVVIDEHKYVIRNNKVSYFILYTFDYSGDEKSIEIKRNGYYKLEVWGAQGGSYNSTYRGGYGGYSSGYVYLESGAKLYINVGGMGKNNCHDLGSSICYGGYNGGGNGGGPGDGLHYPSSGGGATHISLKSGLLSTLENDVDKILIVAGGGSGSYYHTHGDSVSAYGGSGGGYMGTSGKANSGYNVAIGGSQSKGGSAGNSGLVGSFGHGGNGVGGGGGGFYGGGSAAHSGSGGGSGYIGNNLLINKNMYCYNCLESSDLSIKTISTTSVSDNALSNNAKSGNGYAIITYMDEYDIEND